MNKEAILFKNKYNSKTTRLQTWDYSSFGYYFVTICTKDRQDYFGKINHGKMEFTAIGRIADQYWRDIPNHFDDVILDSFVVMPNHTHGIVVIDPGMVSTGPRRDEIYRVPTDNNQKIIGGATGKHNPMLSPNSLGRIIREYKSAVTRYCTKNGITPFAWQPRFHDRIIRDENELNRVRLYIQQNPEKWERDRNNKDDSYPD